MNKFRLIALAGLAASAMIGAAVPAFAASDDGQNRKVRVYNEAGQSIWRFYASNINEDDWQEDMLHSSIITSGRSQLFNIDDGTGHCFYDFKAIMKDGTSVIRRRVNVCQISSWTISN